MKRLALTWVILTSVIYLINNYYYYLSKEAEAKIELEKYLNYIALVYNNLSDQGAKNSIENLPLSYRYQLNIESFNKDQLRWEIKKDSRIDKSRSTIVMEKKILGNSGDTYLNVSLKAYISPSWWKGLIRAWSWSFWEREGWWKYRLYQRSLPLYSYGAILFIFGILFKYFVDNYYKTRMEKANKLLEDIDLELKAIEQEKEKLINEKQEIENKREMIRKERDDLKLLDEEVSDHLKELDEREKSIFEKEQMLDRKEDAYMKNIEKAEKVIEPENENNKRILFKAIDNEIKNYLIKNKTKERFSYHGEYQNYKKMADKIVNTDISECFSKLSNCEYQSAHRKTISVIKMANNNAEIQIISGNDKGTGLSLGYEVKDKKYSSPVGFSLSLLLKSHVKDLRSYKIRIVS